MSKGNTNGICIKLKDPSLYSFVKKKFQATTATK